MAWRVGERVAGFELEGVLGRGGMGVVYRARHLESGKRVALKTLPLDASLEARARFEREGQAQARVDRHPHVARVHSAGEAEGRGFLVLDLVAGGDLDSRLRQGPLEVAEALRVTLEVGRGLAHAHAHGVLHRDLKPANVLFDEQERAKLVDFGLARLEGEGTLTRSHQTMGTPGFMAPEQVDNEDVGPAADVYGLGALLFACLTAHPPFRGVSAVATLYQVLNDAPPAPSSLVPGVPPALDRLVARALAKSPSERYASAAEMVAALEACGGDQAEARRGRALTLGLSLGVLACLAAAGVVLSSASPRVPPASPSAPSAASPATTPSPGAERSRWHLSIGDEFRLDFGWREVTDGGFTIDVSGRLSGEVRAEEAGGWRVEAEVWLEHFGTRKGSLVTSLPADARDQARGRRDFTFLLAPSGEVSEPSGLASIGERVAAKMPELDLLGERSRSQAKDVVRSVYDDERLARSLSATLGLFVADAPWERDGPGYRVSGGARLRPALPNLSIGLHTGGRYALEGEATFSLGRVHRSRLEQTETFVTRDPSGRQVKKVIVEFSVALP